MKTTIFSCALLLTTIQSGYSGWLYSVYSGAYREWPTAAESMAEESHSIPVYRTWPSKPYEVLGSLRHEDARKEWQTGEIRDAAREAKKKGGNAIIVRYTSEMGVAAVTGLSREASLFRAQTTALVIRFLTDGEISARDRRRKALFKEVLRANPTVGFSEDTGDIAIKYLLQSGVKETASEFQERFVELMNRVRPRTTSDVSGEWLFKANLKASTLTASDESSFFGIAVVNNDQGNLAIVSKQGNVEFNYSGKLNGGKLEGQLGIANVSAKSDGVLLGEKISLTFQALTGSGTVQGTVVLQRADNPVQPAHVSPATPKTL